MAGEKLGKLLEEATELVNPAWEREKDISRKANQLIVDDQILQVGVEKLFKEAFDRTVASLSGENLTGNDKSTIADKVYSLMCGSIDKAKKRAGASNW